ncbi:hypothetical protein LQV05_003172 [Cryptococcus neoformans]|nr:hypothetical protein LQV05_003172 [Cryptococcus neoformans]
MPSSSNADCSLNFRFAVDDWSSMYINFGVVLLILLVFVFDFALVVDKDEEEGGGNESIPPGTSLSPISNPKSRPSKTLRLASIHQKTGFGITNTDTAILFNAKESGLCRWDAQWVENGNEERIPRSMKTHPLCSFSGLLNMSQSSGSITPAILCFSPLPPSPLARSPPQPPQTALKTISPHPASSLHPSAPFHGITTLSGSAGMVMPLVVIVGICICVRIGRPDEGRGTEAREARAPRSVSDTRW